MSNSVDNRIVQMQFDNKQFESGIKTSTISLENLKKGLDLSGAAKGLTDLDKAGKSFSLAGIANSVDTLANKFSTLGIIGVTALVNITNSAINAGKNMIKALTVDPILSGLNEYETKMNAITTILTNTASKGTTLDNVNDALAELNTYADQTIYNFAEMTRNIGTFTAAGVDLKTSVEAIKGIANLAAGSGSSALQASTAMYQLSQALAAGSVKLQDWNSVVNAGMGGELFQKALEKTAKELGHGRNMAVSFRDSLETGWITTEVLTKTLQKFANDPSLTLAATEVKTFTQLFDTMKESVQSGWAISWEYIIGHKGQAATMLTQLSNAFNNLIGPSTDARNAMLKFWNEQGGRDALIEGISNTFKALMSVLGPIGQAFREIFPRETGQNLVLISNAFKNFTSHLILGQKTMDNIKMVFKGFFSVLDIGLQLFKLVGGAIGLVLSKLLGLSMKAIVPGTNGILAFAASIGQAIVNFDNWLKSSGIIQQSINNFGSGLAFASTKISELMTFLKPFVAIAVTSLQNAFQYAYNNAYRLGDALEFVKGMLIGTYNWFMTTFKGTKVLAAGLDTAHQSFSNVSKSSVKFLDVLKIIGGGIIYVVRSIKNFLLPIFESIKKKFDEFSMQDIGALLTGGGLIMLARTLNKTLSGVNNIIGNFANILGEVGDAIKAFQLKVKAEALLKIGAALLMLAIALTVLSRIDMASLAKGLGAITALFIELIIGLKMLDKSTKTIGLFEKSTKLQLISLGISLLLLASAAKVISSIDSNKLTKSVGAIGALMGLIALFVKLTKGGDLKKSAGGLIGFSIGIVILAGALYILGKIDPNTLIQGGVALSALLTVIGLFVKLTNGSDLKKSAGGLIGFSVGLLILTGALAILGKMNVDTLIQGGVALVTLLSVIALFVNLTRGDSLQKSAGGLMAFSVGLLILVGALAILGNMNIKNLIQGGVALSTLMAVIALFIKNVKGGDLKASASGLLGFSIGIIILVKALTMLAGLDTGRLIQGTVAIVALMSSIALFIKLTNGGDLKKSAAGLIGFSIGLIVLSGAVFILASINPDRVTQGVIALVSMMTAIGLFINLTKGNDFEKTAKAMIKFSIGIMILAGTLAILSALNTEKLIMASVALSAIIAVIALFVNIANQGNIGKASVGLIVMSVAIGILAASLFVISQLDFNKLIAAAGAITVVLLAITAFAYFTSSANLILTSVALVVFSGALIIMGQALVSIGSIDITTLLTALGALAGVLIILGVASVVLGPLIPIILALGVALVLFGAACLATGAGMLLFSQGLTNLSQTGKAGVEVLTEVVKKLIALIPLALTTLAVGLLKFIKVLGDNAPIVAQAFMKIVNAILDTAVYVIPKLVDAGMRLVLGILKGIRDHIQQIVEAAISIIVNFVNGITNNLPRIIDAAFKLIISFINGLAAAIENNSAAIRAACWRLVQAIIKAISDMHADMVRTGENMIGGMIRGIGNKAWSLKEAAKNAAWNAYLAAKKKLGIESPSKEFAKLGMFSILGFANALGKYSHLSDTEASNVGGGAINSLKNAMGNISDAVGNSLDMNPTIRPVIDLSNVSAGASAINSMLSKNNGISVNTANIKAAAISSGMAAKTEIVQNGSNGTPQIPNTPNPRPAIFQLMLQNGKAIAEFVVDDLDSITGTKNTIAGRMVGL